MNPQLVREIAGLLQERLAGSYLGRVSAPGRWDLGVEVPGGLTLGFCWQPASLAVGLCSWAWPKAGVAEALKAHLQSARLEAVRALDGEPVLLLRLKGDRGRTLVWEGIGRSSNLLLLDSDDVILWSGRVLGGPLRDGRPGTQWVAPHPREKGAPNGPSEDAERYLMEGGPEKIREGLLARARRQLLAALIGREKALLRRREAVLGDRAEAEEWLGAEALGRALMASGDLRERGEISKRVLDYGRVPPAEVEVALDPARTLLENAQLLFKRSRKAQARLERTAAVLREIDAERARIPVERAEIERSEDLAALYPSRPAHRRTQGRGLESRLPVGVARVPLPMEFSGYAGKNAQGNDAVSFRIGRGADFWFHAEDYPGCHVVVKNPDRRESLPAQVEQAAGLYAAAHSGAPGGNRVAVTVAQCKNLRRVPGALGRVWVAGPRTLFVDLPPSR